MFDARAALDAILPHLDRGDAPASKWPDGNGEYWALCPYHADQHVGSFSVSENGFFCHACHEGGGLKKLAEHLKIDLGGDTAAGGLTLAEYAAAKHLPETFLQGLGVTERKRNGRSYLRIPYLDATGAEMCARYRIAMTGDKFRWAAGSAGKLNLYALSHLDPAAAEVHVPEGESNTQTLLYHGLSAVGAPGAGTWKSAWADHLKGKIVYVWRDPDKAGTEFVAKVGKDLPDARVIDIKAATGYKDISEAHIAGADVPALVARLKTAARPYRELAAEAMSEAAQAAERTAGSLLMCPDILAEFGRLLPRLGLVGEDKNAELLLLCVITRLLERPVSAKIGGPSSGGKSFTLETVLKTCPPTAYYALSSMSERALAYDEEPLAHRFLVIYEAAGLGGDMATYLLRSLLSENRVRYLTVEKTADGMKPKLIERAGPTGLFITTTWASLHAENETRLLSLAVRDDREQTRGVFQALADRVNGNEPEAVDLAPWHALHSWLELAGVKIVTIPYAHALGTLADPLAVRLRRDFNAILSLTLAHAVLHQKTRSRDDRGRIVATLADYRAVYDLVIDIVSQGVAATVSQATRETVEAVAALTKENEGPVSVTQVAERLDIDKAAASRRVAVALEGEFLIDTAEKDQKGRRKKGRPAQLSLGDPLPADKRVLPTPDDLEKYVSAIPTVNTSTRQHVAAEPAREVFEL